MEQRGYFFAFEGIDGSGKSTQIQLLQEHIEACGVRCLKTKEPTDGPVGSLVHQCMTGRTTAEEHTLAALFAADRLDHLLNETDGLCHKIQEGISVISDRYILSNYAYQSVQVPLDWLQQLNSQATQLLKPDCYIFIDIDPDTSLERMAKSRFHAELYETRERLTEVRNRYFDLFDQLEDQEHIFIVNGNQSVEAISKDIWGHIARYYDTGIDQ